MRHVAALLSIVALAVAPMAPAAAQSPAPPSTPNSTPTATPGVLVGSDSLVGSTVRDASGRDIGKVNRLMIDPAEGKVASVIIATGGTLGVGANLISVPWGSVKVGQDRGRVIVTASQVLESAPTPTQKAASDQPQPTAPRQ
jgi:sporulation protein YlmC with PRC-barrel domain